jgi:hypothetical protein
LPGYWGDARPAASVLSEMTRSATRLATSSGVRRAPPISLPRQDRSLATRISPEVLRAMALASTLTATAIGGSLLYLVW